MKSETFKIEGMHCDGCAARIQVLLARKTGVHKAVASFEDGNAEVLYDPESVSGEQLISAIENAGYHVAGKETK